jgi:hypothetical protein
VDEREQWAGAGGGDFKHDIYLIHYKNFLKYTNVPPLSSTTIIIKKSLKKRGK